MMAAAATAAPALGAHATRLGRSSFTSVAIRCLIEGSRRRLSASAGRATIIYHEFYHGALI